MMSQQAAELVNALQQCGKDDNPSAIITCLEAISSFAEINASTLGQVGACEAVIAAVKQTTNNAQVFEQACSAILNLYSASENIARLEQCGVCEFIVKILLAECTTQDGSLARLACGVVWCLAADSHCKRVLGELGACGALVSVLTTGIGLTSEFVAETGCQAVTNLAFKSIDNRVDLAKHGACQAVVNILIQFGPESEDIAEQACAAIWTLAASAENKALLGDCGACKAVMLVMTKFGNDAVTQQCCHAIWSLCDNDPRNCAQFAELGACELLVNILLQFGNASQPAEVTELALRAMNSLLESNRQLLINAGARKAVEFILQQQVRDNDTLTTCANELLAKLNA